MPETHAVLLGLGYGCAGYCAKVATGSSRYYRLYGLGDYASGALAMRLAKPGIGTKEGRIHVWQPIPLLTLVPS